MKLPVAVLSLMPFLLMAQTRVVKPLGALEGETNAGIRVFRGVPVAKWEGCGRRSMRCLAI